MTDFRAFKEQFSFTKVTITVIVILLMFMFPSIYTLFLGILLVWWTFQLDSKIIAGVALSFLLLTAFVSLVYEYARAERLAVYVYFLLAIVLILQLLEFKRGAKVQGTPPDEFQPHEGYASVLFGTPQLPRRHVEHRRRRAVGNEIYWRPARE